MSKVSYTTYVLFSKSCNKTYIGQTQDLDKRLEKHNKGYVRSTKNCGPWTAIFIKNFPSRSEAFQLETKLKSFKKRTFLFKWIEENS